ncbi:Domain of uncharacterised function (DUF1853) [Neisseria animaloris]|uniref:DUF1853 family protein n=1 Tax=Neisseria animaloris TaxID=326522 RepID=UPI000A198F32|nr:DUF1853 family protein [Neisseria animaloris]OSI08870.1 hypothetical protein BWD08_01810 [Neisseria animaloris]VEH87155.1 Domain of uncharacterised function (DUF1853) [Neisseria animaloris]
MNYALDALWWRLTDPNVRDLASVLTAPALWHSGCELPVRELLGETGFRYLLDLDDRSEALQQYLADKQPFGHRLGLYAEHLLAFWLSTAPHASLLGQNVAVSRADGQTAGAADFIAVLNGRTYHIELTCKYYGCASGRPSEMVGLNRQDRLQNKAAKLPQQLALLQSEAGREASEALGLEPQRIKAVSIVRGVGFSAQPQPLHEAPLNPYGWHGSYIADWAEYNFSDGLNRRYCLLPRMNLLAPARMDSAETQNAENIRKTDSGVVAVLEQRPDGWWHEVKRVMKAEAV